MATKDLKKVVSCKWIIVCGSSTVDGDSNNISLLNVFDEIQIGIPENELKLPGQKAAPHPLEAVVLWEREEGSVGPIGFPFSVDYTDPSGKVLVSMSGEVKMEETHKRFRARFKLNAVPFTDAGEYKFVVVSGDVGKTGTTESCRSYLNIRINTAPSTEWSQGLVDSLNKTKGKK
ncbi:MAG: hypothetical protein V4644_03660 [Patescibacteria group bacterium]